MKRPMYLALTLLLAAACGRDEITIVDADTYDTYSNIDFDRTVSVTFSSGGTATVEGTSDEVSCTVSGNCVTVTNSGSETVQYTLSGSSSNGYFKVYSGQPQAVVLNSLTLANPNGAAINLQGPASSPGDGERTYLVLNGSSSLADGSSYSSTPSNEDEKAALFAEGPIVVSGSGSLAVTATGRCGMASDDYVRLAGGSLSVSTSASTTASGGDTTKISALKSKDKFIVSGGTLSVSATGTGAKGISGDGTATFSGGTVSVSVGGANFGSSSSGGPGPGSNSSNSVAAKGIKFGGDIAVSGGLITVSSANHEGIESKSSISISGGQVYSYSGADDAINASSDISISGGYVAAVSTSNDGLDANGNIYLSGGVVYAVGASSPEEAIDVNLGETDGVELVLSGGVIIAVGGLSSGATLNQACYSASYTSGTAYTLTVGGTTYQFTAPSGAGSPLVVSGSSTPTLQSGGSLSGGTAYCNNALTIGGSLSGGTSVSLSSYSGGTSGGGPGGGQPGGGPGGH